MIGFSSKFCFYTSMNGCLFNNSFSLCVWYCPSSYKATFQIPICSRKTSSGKRNQQVQYISTPPPASFSSDPQYYQRLAAAQARPRVNQAREVYVQEGKKGVPNPALNALNTRNEAQQPQPSFESDVQPAQSNVKSEAQYWQSDVGFGRRPRQGEHVYMKDKLQGTINNC